MRQALHALIYCRAARNSTRALELQQERCKRKALELGATETLTILDRGSARDAERSALQHLRSLLRLGTIDLVVVESPERLSRRQVDLRELSRDVSRAGARLVFVVA